MAITSLPARANVGAGTDQLAVEEIDGKLAAVVRTTDNAGTGKEIATEITMAGVASLLEEIAARLTDIGDSVGNLSPDIAGRLRVTAEVVANIATITTVTTVGNQTSIGGLFANQQIIALTQMAERGLRDNIVIS